MLLGAQLHTTTLEGEGLGVLADAAAQHNTTGCMLGWSRALISGSGLDGVQRHPIQTWSHTTFDRSTGGA